MKFRFSIFLMVLCVFVTPSSAQQSLFISPSKVTLDRTDNIEVINISNLSTISRAYKVSVQDLIMTEAGFTAPVDTFEYSAKRMIRFFPRSFTLAPNEKQSIRVMFRPKPNAEEGTYHTHLRFLEDVTKRENLNKKPGKSNEATISAPLTYESLIPVTVYYGNSTVKAGIKEGTATYNAETGEIKIDLVVTREGNSQARAFIETDYVDANGSSTPADVTRSVAIYREITERKRDYTFKADPNMLDKKLRVSIYTSKDDEKPSDQIDLTLVK